MRIVMRDRSGNGGSWRLVESKDYGQEVNMHALLAESPTLIPTDELPGVSSPFVVAVREFSLPGSGSTDLVLFSPSGDIAVVECKLATNAEIKRKVIGQILEYGAYLWRMTYEEVDDRVRRQHPDGLAEAMRKAVADDGDWDEEAFRASVAETLRTGSFNLIIAVDAINDELSRTIAFLNGCGNPAFTFHALALPRFQSGHVEILVPDLHGPTVGTTPPSANRWTEERFQGEVAKLTTEAAAVIRDVHEWIRTITGSVRFGTGTAAGSTSLYLRGVSREVRVFTAYTYGRVELAFGSLILDSLNDVAETLHSRLRRLPGFGGLPDQAAKYPSVSIQEAFVDHPENLDKFKQAVLAAVESIRAAQTTGEQP